MNRRGRAPSAGDPQWATLLPVDPRWVVVRRLRPGPSLYTGVTTAPSGTVLGVAWPRWRLAGRRWRGEVRPGARQLLAIPSAVAPLILMSPDREAWEYVRSSVLTVPPGAGPVKSLLFTAALTLLRLPGTWPITARFLLARIEIVTVP